MSDVRIVARDGRDMLGEGPLWSPARRALFWVDILAPALRCLHLDDGAVESWPVPERIGWVIERDGRDDLLVGLRSGFAALALDPFEIRHIGDPEPDRPDNRLNDAKVDARGRIWAGSKHDEDAAASGALYCLDTDCRWLRHDDGYGVANGPAFSPNGATMYHTDSAIRTIYAFDLDAHGQPGNKRVFLRFADDWGFPDGMTTDRAGGLWVAHWEGARVSRFHPDGRLDRSIALPASRITSIAFAGDRLDRMFVTSARGDDDCDPLGGALFEVNAGVVGLPTRRFAG